MVEVKCLTHLPGIFVEQDPLDCFGGRLVTVPFDDWVALEAGGWKRERSNYVSSAPVFFETRIALEETPVSRRLLVLLASARNGSITADGLEELLQGQADPEAPLKTAMNRAGEDAELVHGAMLLGLGTLPPPPSYSVTYAVWLPHWMRMRQIGAMGRYLIIHGHTDKVIVDARRTGRLSRLHELIAASAPYLPRHHEALRQFQRTCRPEFDITNRIVHQVGALERLLFYDRVPMGTLGVQLSARAASLAATDDAGATRWWASARKVYGVRSDIMHGRASHREDSDSLNQTSALLSSVIKNCLALWNATGRPSDFEGRLADALAKVADAPNPALVRGRISGH